MIRHAFDAYSGCGWTWVWKILKTHPCHFFPEAGRVFIGAVENSLPNGIGNMMLNKFLVKGKFIDGKPSGRMIVTNLEDDSSYFGVYEDGVECLEKRKMRKVTSAADYEDDDLELEPEEESMAALKQRVEALQEKIKSKEEEAKETPAMEEQ